MEYGWWNNKNGYFRIIEKEIKKRIIPVKKEDLLTELGKNSRLIKLTVEAKKSVTKEVRGIPVGEIIENMTNSKPEEFFFKVVEEEDNEQS